MYVYIKRFQFICKIFFSLFLSLFFFFFPTEKDDEVQGENKLHYSFQNGSRSLLKMGHRHSCNALAVPACALQEEGI